MNPTFGVLTIANGRPEYLQMAIDLALSVQDCGHVPVTIVAQAELIEGLGPEYDSLRPLLRSYGRGEQPLRRNLAKLSTARLSPYINTLFLDAGTLVTNDLRHLVIPIANSLSGYVMQGEYLPAGEDRIHNRWSTAQLCRRFGLASYLKSNSGILGMRTQEAISIQETIAAAARYFRWKRLLGGGYLSDEILHGICAEQLQIDVFRTPLPMAWSLEHVNVNQLPLVVHAIGKPALPTTRWLEATVTRLRRAAGLPEAPGLAAWRNKINKKR